jgi:16S rRNA (cytidine1402-2'-O)-methyltransferase
MGKLYIVPTPIGNLGDMTFRSIEVLKQADAVLAEDTRTSSHLLKHFGIGKPLQAYHQFNEHRLLQQVINRLLAGQTLAMISDAGTPGISDAGFLMVRECVAKGIEVECLPGATALIPAVVLSGFPCNRFCFEGFLPAKKGRQKRWKELVAETRTIVIYESPHRLLKTLSELKTYFGGERQMAVSRELTKLHEETVRATIEEQIEIWSGRQAVKGEIVLTIEGQPA